ncbi:MAG: hypothetical protein U0905_13670 [Pirellulales bacterium]
MNRIRNKKLDIALAFQTRKITKLIKISRGHPEKVEQYVRVDEYVHCPNFNSLGTGDWIMGLGVILAEHRAHQAAPPLFMYQNIPLLSNSRLSIDRAKVAIEAATLTAEIYVTSPDFFRLVNILLLVIDSSA